MGCESRDAYNARFEEAFAQRRLKAWPYSGAVIIEEKSIQGNEAEVFVVDQWCLLYSFRYSLDRYEMRVRGAHRFDYDSYKILCSYLLEEEHQETVRALRREDVHRILEGFDLGPSGAPSPGRIGTAVRKDLGRMVNKGRFSSRVSKGA